MTPSPLAGQRGRRGLGAGARCFSRYSRSAAVITSDRPGLKTCPSMNLSKATSKSSGMRKFTGVFGSDGLGIAKHDTAPLSDCIIGLQDFYLKVTLAFESTSAMIPLSIAKPTLKQFSPARHPDPFLAIDRIGGGPFLDGCNMQVANYIGPYLRQMNEWPARRSPLPKLMLDRITLWRPGMGAASRYVFHVFDPRNATILLGSSTSFYRAEKMVNGEIPMAIEFEPERHN